MSTVLDRIVAKKRQEIQEARCRVREGDLEILLEKAVPVYEWFDGWRTSTAAARTLGELPFAARRYLDRIRELADTPISYVSVGTHRDQIIGVE